jgi:hypothetical protein
LPDGGITVSVKRAALWSRSIRRGARR